MRPTIHHAQDVGRYLKGIWHSQAGFTIIEMLTVFLVIGILATLLLVNTRTGDRRQELRDATAGFITQVRNVEARAAAAEPIADAAGTETSRRAYGICVSSTATATPCQPPLSGLADEYQLYARRVADTNYSQRPANPDILRTVPLPKDVVLTTTVGWLDYLPPQPSMLILGSTANRSVRMRQVSAPPSCVGSPDCLTIQFRPRSGAVYVQ